MMVRITNKNEDPSPAGFPSGRIHQLDCGGQDTAREMWNRSWGDEGLEKGGVYVRARLPWTKDLGSMWGGRVDDVMWTEDAAARWVVESTAEAVQNHCLPRCVPA
jgi:hypothetical protein